jgi:myo-inositol 2-dehydrogenase/D-chiro-inositol 1-dehydrogenase
MTLNVGLIGLGEVAQLMHLPLLADDPRFRIAAVTDLSPSLTARIAARYNARALPDAAALTADATLDAVFVLTPDHLHAAQAEAVIRAGRHLFLEKPAALTAAQLRPLLDLDRDNPRIAFVGYMRRYAPAFLELKRRLPPAGQIRHVRIRDIIAEAPFFTAQTRPVIQPQDLPAAALAEGRAATQALLRDVMGPDAGPDQLRAYQVLTGLSSHSFSAMRELLGRPRTVAASRQHGGETVVVLFDYGHFTALYEAVIHDVARFDAGIEVLTADRHFRITYDTPYVRHLPTRLEITASTPDSTGTEIVGPFYRDAFRAELDAFHHAVTTGTRPKTTLADALEDLELFAEVGRGFLTQTTATEAA